MNIFKTTKNNIDYWTNRKVDWKKSYLDTADHPHRKIIVGILKELPWLSLLEIGCNSAPNLKVIIQNIPGRQVGGVDVNPEAIDLARKTFKNGFFKVNPADDIMMSDKSVDVVLSDMTLIYVNNRDINRYLKEIKRLARNYVILCEFHSKSWWNRMAGKINTGYNIHNFDKLLRAHNFYDLAFYKLKPKDWPGGGLQEKFGYVILAKVSKY